MSKLGKTIGKKLRSRRMRDSDIDKLNEFIHKAGPREVLTSNSNLLNIFNYRFITLSVGLKFYPKIIIVVKAEDYNKAVEFISKEKELAKKELYDHVHLTKISMDYELVPDYLREIILRKLNVAGIDYIEIANPFTDITIDD